MEITDRAGTTDSFTGAVDAAGVNLPASAGSHIDELSIRCTVDQPNATRLEFSLDGGTNWFRLRVGEAREEEPRGLITQVRVRAAGTLTTANYEVIMNRAPV